MKNEWLLVGLLVLGNLGLAALEPAPVSAQNGGISVMSSAAVTPMQALNPQVQTFRGQIVESPSGEFVFKDVASNLTFHLDPQVEARPFSGKNVKVTGSEDAGNKIIHVLNIQEA